MSWGGDWRPVRPCRVTTQWGPGVTVIPDGQPIPPDLRRRVDKAIREGRAQITLRDR